MLVHLRPSDDIASNSFCLGYQIFMRIFRALNAQWATKILRWAIKCKPQTTSLENLICTILSIKDILTPKPILITITVGRWTREENCKYENKNSLERLDNRFLKGRGAIKKIDQAAIRRRLLCLSSKYFTTHNDQGEYREWKIVIDLLNRFTREELWTRHNLKRILEVKHVVYIHILTLYRQSYNVSILLRLQHSITYKIWRSSSSSSLCRWWSEFHLYESLFANPLRFKQMKNWKNMEALTSSRLRKKSFLRYHFTNQNQLNSPT